VQVFVMGVGGWREMDDWPPPSRPLAYYLRPNAASSRQALPAKPDETLPPSEYVYDPHNPTPSLGGALMSVHAGRRDNRALESRSDVLTFTTPPLERPLEIIGPVRLVLYVRSSQSFTDFFGRLCDVQPDGRSINICDGLLRIAPGVGQLQPDGCLRSEIDLWSTAYRFAGGHRLRLQVSSGAHPRWSRNPGSGEPLATAVRLIPAQQAVYHDRLHPSALVLPATET
jgi:putative CocE/NonD family hydrolase